MVVAKMNWALLPITEGISPLDLWKYANAILICTSNYVPFNVRQSGTFTLYLNGKFIQCGASCSGLAGHCVKMACYTVQVHVYWHPWVTASGVRFSTGTIAQTGKICWNVLKICGLSILLLSKEQSAGEYEFFHQVSLEKSVLDDVYRGYITSVNLHNVNFSGIK